MHLYTGAGYGIDGMVIEISYLNLQVALYVLGLPASKAQPRESSRTWFSNFS